MTRVTVNRLLVLTLYLDDHEIVPGESIASTAREIARDVPEGDWLVADEWVEP